jgi:hypothetical protein
LGLREAREKAQREWARMGNPVEAPEEKSCWTRGELVENYKAHISGMRQDSSGRPIYPSAETQSDVRQIFGRKEVACHAGLLLTNLNEDWFGEIQDHADRRVSSGAGSDLGLCVLSTTSRSAGWTALGPANAESSSED